jgi:peroxiredoxin Q/BCP
MPVRLEPGDPAPDFDLPDDSGGRVRLADLRGQRILLYVYPAAMTPGCTKQACDFRAAEGLTFTLASDPDRTVLAAYGAYGEKQLYGRTVTGVIRSTFVIDAEGRIEQARYNVRATGHVAKLRRELGV